MQPSHPPYHANLSEYLSGAHLFAEALDVAGGALTLFPEYADLKTRYVALAIFMYLIPVTLIIHNPMGGNPDNMLQFMKNLSIMGGLLFMYTSTDSGPGLSK